MPSSSATSTSTVGLPRESRISRAPTASMLATVVLRVVRVTLTACRRTALRSGAGLPRTARARPPGAHAAGVCAEVGRVGIETLRRARTNGRRRCRGRPGTTRLRPIAFARYSAPSAACSSSASSVPSVGMQATPIDTASRGRTSSGMPVDEVGHAQLVDLRAAVRSAIDQRVGLSGVGQDGHELLAAEAAHPVVLAHRGLEALRPTPRNTASPTRCPNRSLTILNRSTSMISTANRVLLAAPASQSPASPGAPTRPR